MNDTGGVRRIRLPLAILPLALAALTGSSACVNDVRSPTAEPAADPGAEVDVDALPVAGGPSSGAESDDGSGQAEPPADEEPAEPPGPVDEDPTDGSPGDDLEPGDAPPDEVDPDGDGVVDAGDPGPPPADAGQQCVEWTDCAPHYDNLNSGFDCSQNTCICDAIGQWAVACANIGGWWSDAECFCFTNTDSAMPSEEPEPPDEAEEDVTCWWTWRIRSCEPDEWVDTSYYERVCDDHGCWNEYVEDGYWVDGRCTGRWIKRCTDGNEYWY